VPAWLSYLAAIVAIAAIAALVAFYPRPAHSKPIKLGKNDRWEISAKPKKPQIPLPRPDPRRAKSTAFFFI
jgi:hypothetical protein